jgi:Ca2+-binding EF-hand superfamily protein
MRTKTPNKSQPVVIPAREKLSQHDLEELKSTFDLFDDDGTGSIDPQEIQKILQELGLDKRNEAVFQMILDLQTKGKSISFDDFLEVIYSKLGDTRTKEGLLKIFNLYDVDQTGAIDFEKVKRVCRELGETMTEEEIIEMMHNTHILNQTESNEEFTFEEFYAIIMKKKY